MADTDAVGQKVEDLNYMEIIGLVNETNRPPGGIQSLISVAQRTLLDSDDHVLEVGTSTGFTSLELSRLVGCSVTGIDVNEESLKEARRRASELGVEENIQFEQEDATELTYDDDTFDVVFVGNVTAYVGDTEAALSEYTRVLKPGGFLVALPMYYHQTPNDELLEDVREAIGTDIDVTDREYWIDFFDREDLRLHHTSEFEFDFVSEKTVEEYAQNILDRSELDDFDTEAREALSQKYREYLLLFRENLQHLRYSMMILRKDPGYEPELFTSSRVE